MKLTSATTIASLVSEYPFLIEALAERNTKFEKLRNPILLKTIGRFATVEKAASLGQEDTLELLLFIAGEILAQAEELVEITPPKTSVKRGTATKLTDEQRQESMKSMIRALHEGADVASLKDEFSRTVGDIAPEEIAKLEQSLVNEGLKETEIKRLCNLHVEIFKDSLEEQELPDIPPGHPIHTYMEENTRVAEVTDALLRELDRLGNKPEHTIWSLTVTHLKDLVAELMEYKTHYIRKENQLFPLLEAHGVEAPTKVMWEIHDDVRDLLRKSEDMLQAGDKSGAVSVLRELAEAVNDMMYKEKNVLFPMSLEILSEQDWARMRSGDDEIGYCFDITPGSEWVFQHVEQETEGAQAGMVNLATGKLPVEIVNAMLCKLPVDISFVDSKDKVAYYSDSEHRIFPRSPEVIGRDVKNCHPPKSVHMVNEILDKFRNGERDHAEFWLELGGKFLHIQYMALRDAAGTYLGCLEVGQDATYVRSLEGQRRLLEWS
ncbi:MAG: hypothetical protein CSB34_03425 [Desulfobulbus propionicus]|nr:MAG: hypothetical protein CSB34_03425 [Desulfobulbus propionicus]